jgi:hypothetical protein
LLSRREVAKQDLWAPQNSCLFIPSFPRGISRWRVIPVLEQLKFLNSDPRDSGLRLTNKRWGRLPFFLVWGRKALINLSKTFLKDAATVTFLFEIVKETDNLPPRIRVLPCDIMKHVRNESLDGLAAIRSPVGGEVFMPWQWSLHLGLCGPKMLATLTKERCHNKNTMEYPEFIIIYLIDNFSTLPFFFPPIQFNLNKKGETNTCVWVWGEIK